MIRQQAPSPVAHEELLERVDIIRGDANRRLNAERRAELGQFFTAAPIARLMASMLGALPANVRLLDAGAGVGPLSAAVVAELCQRREPPKSISVTAYEVDPMLAEYLSDTMALCKEVCAGAGVVFEARVLVEDFVEAGAAMLQGGLFSPELRTFNAAILNPPYKKIHSQSRERALLRQIGIEISNIYPGFLSVVLRLLDQGGEMVAITPRSFCNGSYFREFRRWLLNTAALRHVHVFERRDQLFSEDDVLQENIVFGVVKGVPAPVEVEITCSSGDDGDFGTIRRVPYDQVVRPSDPQAFIHLVADDLGHSVVEKMNNLRASLPDLGVSVSTGRVVDFRATQFIKESPEAGTVPLVYPGHIRGGLVVWPEQKGSKPNAILDLPESADLLIPAGVYVLVKRFTAKEERRRVVAAIYDPEHVAAAKIGFENHLNYYHVDGGGLPRELAMGMAAFLNSTLLDMFFRQFNGHTQVNATDLRNLRYPTKERLEALGTRIGDLLPDQEEIDRIVTEEIFGMAEGSDPVAAKKRIAEAEAVLKALGLPKGQLNERSALTLLALLDLAPEAPWVAARSPLIGVTPIMEYIEKHYGRKYAPNTRETIRRFTLHQFVQAGLALLNPDDPNRPINSPKNVYQIEPAALELIRQHDSASWDARLREYLTSVDTLVRKYARERDMGRIPVLIAEGGAVYSLSPGGQNVLVKQIIDEFCPRFTPGGRLVYVGDTDKKWAYFDEQLLASLCVTVGTHGKMPDIVVYHGAKNWLVLIEAVTSHGPVNAKRRQELEQLFKGCTAGLVFVTAFLDRKTMNKYLHDISWETEVWLAEAPSHMVHFNGERFLGPY